VGLLQRADGVAEVVAVQAIDFSGREMRALEQDLGPGDERGSRLACAVPELQ
jgi:hypothetical protein